MSNELVSAVIPTYNYAHYVIEAVESALAQTYSNVEVIVVDDGSVDDTREQLQRFGNRIRYIYQTNQGLAAARNAGIDAARGRYVAFLDSDDIWHRMKLELQMRVLQEHRQLAMLGARSIKGETFSLPVVPADTPLPLIPINVEQLAIKTYFGASSVIIRKDCFLSVGKFDISLKSVEDRDMWIRIASRFPAAKLDLTLNGTRLHAGSMSKAAARMEEQEDLVIQRSFSSVDALKTRRLLRRKALGFAAYSASIRYREAGNYRTSLRRLLRSFWLWPLPFYRQEVKRPLMRARSFAVVCSRVLGLSPTS